MKNSLEGFKNILEKVDERFSKLEEKKIEIIESEEQNKNWRKLTETSSSGPTYTLWDS